MTYTLYGSHTSPFVRRMRMLLEFIPYEFKEMNIFETQDAVTLNKINPINQIPVLTDGDQTIWNSRVIFNYLNSKHSFQKMSWDDENLLTAIEGAMEAGVALLMLKRSGINTDEQLMYVARQKDRIESVLDYLKPYITGPAMNDWNFQTMSLYSFLDWGQFRNIFSIEHRPECRKFMEIHSHREIINKTQIPKG
ncbi:MAG: glutathione S-transferase family protein [Bacteriovoracaceae bacterium]